MPPIGMLMGGVDFSNLYVSLSGQDYGSRAAALEAGAPIVSYGAFINNVIAFLITALAVFLLVRAIARMQRREAVSPPAPTEKDCPFCLSRVPLGAVRCPACTSELAAVPTLA
jgi:large conductance mechanosensitive channel